MAFLSRTKAEILKRIEQGTWKTEEEQSLLYQAVMSLDAFPTAQLIKILENTPRDPSPKQIRKKNTLIAMLLSSAPSDAVAPFLADLFRAVRYRPDHIVLREIARKMDGNYIEAFTRFLVDGSDAEVKCIQPILVRIGGREIYVKVAEIAKRGKYTNKITLIELLISIGGSRSVPIIKELLRHSKKEERIVAFKSFGKFKSLAAVEVLGQYVRDPDRDVKEVVAKALGEIGKKECLEPLYTLLKDDDVKIITLALTGIGNVGDAEAIPQVIKFIHYPHARVRYEAVQVLGAIGDERVIDTILERIRDVEESIAEVAFETAVKMAKENRVDRTKILSSIIGSEHDLVREKTADFIRAVGDEDLVWRMVDGLKNEDWWKRNEVTKELVNYQNLNIFEPLVKLLDDPSDIIRRMAVETLGRLQDPRAYKHVLNCLKDDDWWVRERAIEAIGNIAKEKAIPIISPFLKDADMKWVTLEALARIKDTKVVEQIIPLVEDEDADIRMQVLTMLKEYRIKPSLKAMSRLMVDRDKGIRLEAIKTLRRWSEELKLKDSQGIIETNILENKHFTPLDRLLLYTKEKGASDLFLSSNLPPYYRKYGRIEPVLKESFSPRQVEEMLYQIMTDDQRAKFNDLEDLDISYSIEEKDRFRVNIFRQREGVNAVFRVIPDEVPQLRVLGAPEQVKDFCYISRGLVLVVGATGMGKTTTASSMIDYINRNRKLHVITIEDPIEYIHPPRRAIIHQRSLGVHTKSFPNALRAALREDPDVIFIGELRDLESISIALNAAETGHLVIGTLHAYSAPKTIDRIINAFPPDRKEHVRVLLSENLKAIIMQQLVESREEGNAVLAAFEIMIGHPSVSNLIREKKTHQLTSLMSTMSEIGMQTMDQALVKLVKEGKIDHDVAFRKCFNPQEVEKLLELT